MQENTDQKNSKYGHFSRSVYFILWKQSFVRFFSSALFIKKFAAGFEYLVSRSCLIPLLVQLVISLRIFWGIYFGLWLILTFYKVTKICRLGTKLNFPPTMPFDKWSRFVSTNWSRKRWLFYRIDNYAWCHHQNEKWRHLSSLFVKEKHLPKIQSCSESELNSWPDSSVG